MLKYQI